MKKLLILLLLITFTSCSLLFPSIALKRAGVFDTKSKLKTIRNENKKILFLGMHHIGKKEFYDDVAKKVDSLQKLGYTVFYESVTDGKEIDSVIRIKNAMKLRKLFGFFPAKYLDTATNVISGKIKYKGKHKLINQPNYTKLNVDSLTAIKADVSLFELITAFEKEHSEIKLDSCDYKISLRNKKYNCKKADRDKRIKFKMNYAGDYRDKYVIKKIIESKKNKILIIYGDAHYIGLLLKFHHKDKNSKIKL